VCQRSFVFQQRRHKGDRKEVSIQANFAFLNTTGEIVADELSGSVKILVLTEMSRCIGYVEMSKQPGDRSFYGFNIVV
jgi:hypothetical protein